MNRKVPTRKPGSHSRGYNRDEFKEYTNQHVLAFVKRGKKVNQGGKNYFPVSVVFFLEGYEEPDFITNVTGVPVASPKMYVVEKQDMKQDLANKKWTLEMSANPSSDPRAEFMVKLELLLNEEWKGCETLSIVVNPLDHKEKKEDFILTVECDIIIPPPGGGNG
ncbi:hypothetical protein BXY85_2507 [Roseivirga pacifica]|uniref:Uncharacterized protein n=1 Tax=Roseivirga pacifica TaxID=1267423 RepID=A0A1I0NUX8_9BACT|nr:hypothetical protein [Roseivirga pacifica]MCO6360016.1 hypothetical protein [Roseivirga pacifica]MCO6367386.1 hypothetical protein [Roseivirga pacifica]MCO6370083.1 hypothetical protein [Roseivirga pacifica]MCO6375043.1 hypothetical protein [Roseivirga pacifica]MCO6380301.1 hypothetical protein [Roseivirga pacifica]